MPHFPSFEHWFPPSAPLKRRPAPAYTLRHPTEEDLAAIDGRLRDWLEQHGSMGPGRAWSRNLAATSWLAEADGSDVDAADVDAAGAVVVEVVGELVGDGGELKDEVVGVLLAAGTAGMGVEVVQLLGAQVEELDEEKDAVGGVVAVLSDLVDLGLGEGGVAGLGAERRGEGEEEGEGEGEAAEHGADLRGCRIQTTLEIGDTQ